MPPSLALILWLVLLTTLLLLDPGREPGTSPALWVTVTWLFFVASRLPSQWLGTGQVGQAALSMEEGNPLDRTVWTALILLSLGILVSRSFRWGEFFARNTALTLFIGFALFSVLWSDFPDIALKRWFRDLGDYLVVLVALTDPHPLGAVRAVLRRLAYLLIPLSTMLVKYYPGIGVQYDDWHGTAQFAGAATSKNMLGVVCLVSGLFFLWNILTLWRDRREKRAKRTIFVDVAFLAMSLWLLNLSNSATSRTCFVLGSLVIVAANSKVFRSRLGLLKFATAASFLTYLVLVFGLGLNGQMAQAVGRNGNLTDRTLIWNLLLGMHTNPLLGVGYQSFWLGPRLDFIWSRFGPLNEAHNGYLGVYLELGAIGLFLMVAFLIGGYRRICRRLDSRGALGSLGLAMWTIALFYNVSEAAFESGLLWLALLLIVVDVPERSTALAVEATAIPAAEAQAVEQLPVALYGEER
jgi:exopolysaccharide production protein ExoQ